MGLGGATTLVRDLQPLMTPKATVRTAAGGVVTCMTDQGLFACGEAAPEMKKCPLGGKLWYTVGTNGIPYSNGGLG